MKIGLYLHPKNGNFGQDKRIVYTWKEMQKAKEEGYITISEDLFFIIKKLEENKHLLKEINKFRKKFSIPIGGLDKQKYIKNEKYFLFDRFASLKGSDKHEGEVSKTAHEIVDYIKGVREKYIISPLVKYQLINIFLSELFNTANFFHCSEEISLTKPLYVPFKNETPIMETISVVPPFSFSSVRIFLNSPKIKKDTLKKFIDKNWDQIQARLNMVEDIKAYTISDRDKNILELKEIKGKTYRQIAGILSEEGLFIEEDAIKTAYLRATQKIKNLFYPKSGT